MKQTKNNTANSGKKAVKKRAILKEKGAELFRDGKDTVTMVAIDKKRGNGSRSVRGIQIATGGTKSAVTPKGNELKVATIGASKHSAAKGRSAAMNHLINVFNFHIPRM